MPPAGFAGTPKCKRKERGEIGKRERNRNLIVCSLPFSPFSFFPPYAFPNFQSPFLELQSYP
jgi:hypothetical protein